MCGKILIYLEKMATSQPPPLARQQFFEKILILSHRSLRLGPIRRCSFVVFFKTQHVPGSTLCSARIRNGVNGAQPSLRQAGTAWQRRCAAEFDPHKRRGGKSGWPFSSAQAVLKLSKKRALWPNSVFIGIQQCNAFIY